MFDDMQQTGHEQIIHAFDQNTGLRALVGIHNTTLGPALGGCRMWNYANESEALQDVLRLSRSMTYKSAMAGVAFGGGKAVIFGNPAKDKSEALMRSFGKFLQKLRGGFVTGQDVGITSADVLHMHKETKHVVGLPPEMGGTGDPSPMAALGVFSGIKASVAYRLQKDSLRGVRIAVQGCGNVGSRLCHLLHKEEAKLWVSDLDASKAEAIATSCGAQVLDVNSLPYADVDVFAPCALGAVLNSDSIPWIQAKIVAGGANNQLENESEHDEMLLARNILYAPDYVINAGGLISVAHEIMQRPEAIVEKVQAISNTLLEVYRRAAQQGTSTGKTADHIAEERVRRGHF